jgi:hypothetical protein
MRANREHALSLLIRLNKKNTACAAAYGFYHFKFSGPAYSGFGKALEPGISDVADRLAGAAQVMAADQGLDHAAGWTGENIARFLSIAWMARRAARDGRSAIQGSGGERWRKTIRIRRFWESFSAARRMGAAL